MVLTLDSPHESRPPPTPTRLDALGGPDWTKGYSLLAPGGLLVAFGLANVNAGGKRNLLHALGQILRSPRFKCMTLMSDNKGCAIEREPATAYVPAWPWTLVGQVMRVVPARFLV